MLLFLKANFRFTQETVRIDSAPKLNLSLQMMGPHCLLVLVIRN